MSFYLTPYIWRPPHRVYWNRHLFHSAIYQKSKDWKLSACSISGITLWIRWFFFLKLYLCFCCTICTENEINQYYYSSITALKPSWKVCFFSTLSVYKGKINRSSVTIRQPGDPIILRKELIMIWTISVHIHVFYCMMSHANFYPEISAIWA